MKIPFISALIFCCATCSTLTAQDDCPCFHGRKWDLGINFYGAAANHVLAFGNGNASNDLPKFGWSAGFDVQRKFTHSFAVVSGLQFSDKGYRSEVNLSIDDNIAIAPSSVKNMSVHTDFYYLEVPLLAKWSLSDRKNYLTSGIGFSTALFLVETQIFYEKQQNGSLVKSGKSFNHDLTAVNVFPTLFFGWEQPFKNQMRLSEEVMFHYGVVNVQKQLPSDHPWDAGINITCWFGL